jgi:peptidoglycan/LPS O-acetylase OafA/YrhL
MKTKDYFENLDGLRFFCFLSVFFYHSFDTRYDYIRSSDIHQFVRHGIFQHANLGVNFFFVLSGFLITYLLIEEKKLNGYIDIGRFWIRRVLRIWPLFYFSVFFGFYVFPMIKVFFGQTPAETASLWNYLTFLNNFDVIEKGTPDASILGALWSVAVEEQFYLVWPLVLFFLPVKRYWIGFAAVLIISWIYRIYNDSLQLYHFHTLSCIGDMAIGSLGAWLVTQQLRFKSVIVNMSSFQIASVYIIFVCIFLFREELFYGTYFIRVFERSLIACIILLIILEQCYSKNSLFKISQLTAISKLGTISYGLYCFHFVGILIAKTITNTFGFNKELWQVLILETTLALIVTIAISKISFHYYEIPFLNLKQRFLFKRKAPIIPVSSPVLISEKNW